MAKVRACWFSCWLFPRNALQEKEGWNTCRKEILLRRPLSGILFFMTWFALFSFLVLCLLRFVFLQMKSKMLLIVYWITGNVAAHPIQCEIMLTTWLNSSAVPLLCPTRPRNSHISTDLCTYIRGYVMQLDYAASAQNRALYTSHWQYQRNRALTPWARVHEV